MVEVNRKSEVKRQRPNHRSLEAAVHIQGKVKHTIRSKSYDCLNTTAPLGAYSGPTSPRSH
jgi:hypothetical protein